MYQRMVYVYLPYEATHGYSRWLKKNEMITKKTKKKWAYTVYSTGGLGVQNRPCIFTHDEIKAFHPTLSDSIIRKDYLTGVSLLC